MVSSPAAGLLPSLPTGGPCIHGKGHVSIALKVCVDPKTIVLWTRDVGKPHKEWCCAKASLSDSPTQTLPRIQARWGQKE